MAFIGIKVPSDTTKKFLAVEAPGERSGPDEMHITLIYLGKSTSLANIIRSVAVVASMAQNTRPFPVGCAIRTCFPENPDDGFPVIARVQSPTLAKFREELINQIEAAGVEYVNKYPDFKPHVTLSYSDTSCENMGFTPIMWTVDTVNIWGGEEMDDRVITSVELEG